MALSGIFYAVVVATIQTSLFITPYFIKGIEGASYLALLFSGAFVTGLLAIAWRGLKPVHFAVLPIIVLMTDSIALLLLHLLDMTPVYLIESGPDIADFIFRSGIVEGVAMQIFISLILLVGARINESFNRFGFRRAALDLDEVEKIMRIDPSSDIDQKTDIFRYQRLMNRGYSVVGASGNRIECAIHAVRRDRFLFFYDLRISPETREGEAGRRIVENILTRPEIMESGIYVIAVCDEPNSEESAPYRQNGFEDLPPSDPLNREIMQRLKEIDERVSGGSGYLSGKKGLLFYAPNP